MIAYGVTFFVGDVNDIMTTHSLTANAHVGLPVGAVFTLVGASFLWPMRPFQS